MPISTPTSNLESSLKIKTIRKRRPKSKVTASKKRTSKPMLKRRTTQRRKRKKPLLTLNSVAIFNVATFILRSNELSPDVNLRKEKK